MCIKKLGLFQYTQVIKKKRSSFIQHQREEDGKAANEKEVIRKHFSGISIGYERRKVKNDQIFW